MPLTFSRLRWLNAAAGVFQLLTGAACAAGAGLRV